MYTNSKMNLTQYLRTHYGTHNSNVDFIRHVQPLYAKLEFYPRHEILIHGLIAMALGAYVLYDQKLMKLANQTIEDFSSLL